MKRPLRRVLGVASIVLGGMAACDARQGDAPTSPGEPPTEVVSEVPPSIPEPAPSVPPSSTAPEAPPPAPVEQGCASPSLGSIPAEVLNVLTASARVNCGLFPGACAPEPLRRRFPRPASACQVSQWPWDTSLANTPDSSATFDMKGRLTDYDGPGGRDESYRYDGCDRLVGQGRSAGLRYDSYAWEYAPGGRVLQFTYDFFSTRYETRYRYDASGRLLEAETKAHFFTGDSVVSARTEYVHDAQGRIVRAQRVQDPDDSTRRQVTEVEERDYAASGALAELRTTSPRDGSSTNRSFSEGRLVRERWVHSRGSTETVWTYLPNGLLEKEWSHVVDERGTGTREAHSHYGAASRLDTVSVTTARRALDGTETSSQWEDRYSYDAEGNLLLRTSRDLGTGQTYSHYYKGSCF